MHQKVQLENVVQKYQSPFDGHGSKGSSKESYMESNHDC